MDRRYYAIIFLALTSFVIWSNQPVQSESLALGAPSATGRIERSIVPETDSTYYLGTTTPSTRAWKNLIVDEICLAGDCQTAWSAGAGEANIGANLGTGLNLYDSKSGVTLRFNSLLAGSNITLSTTSNANTIVIASTASGSGSGNVSTSTGETAGQLAYWTSTNATPALLGKIATTSLTATSPLSLSQAISVIGSAASALSLDTSGAWSGTAGALAADGGNCSAGSYPLGVDESGAVQDCTDATTEITSLITSAYPFTPSLISGIVYSASTSPFAFINTLVSSTTIGQATFGSFIATTTGTILGNLTASSNFIFGGDTFDELVGLGLDLASGDLVFDCSDVEGTGINCVGEAITLDATGDWTGTFDGVQGADYTAESRALTIAGTANQITSSAGAQDLSADRTWTLSLPSQVNFPNTFFSGTGTSTLFASASSTIGFLRAGSFQATSTTATSTIAGGLDITGGGLEITGILTGCAAFTSGVLNSTGVACGSGGGGSDPFTHPSFGLSATTSQMLIGTSTASSYQLTIASSTAPQISLSSGGGFPQWAFRAVGSNLLIATTTVAGNATTTTSALEIRGDGKAGVAIGTSTPIATLSVNPQSGHFANQFVVGSTSATALRIDNSGHIFMPTLTTATGGNAICIDAADELEDAGGTTCVTSTIAGKENIEDLSPKEALAILRKLRPVIFDWKDGKYSPEDTKQSLSLIAEEVEKIDRRLVDYGYNGKPIGLLQNPLFAVLIGSVIELENRQINYWPLLGLLGLLGLVRKRK